MKLKKDIQVKAFLIRNKIRFEQYEKFFVVNSLTEDQKSQLSNYVFVEHKPDPVYQKAYHSKYKRPERRIREKKKSIKQLLDLEPEPEPEPKKIERPPAIYSNRNFNEL